MKKWLIVGFILIIIIVIILLFFLKLFVVGELVTINKVPISLVTINEDKIEVTGAFQDSAVSYKGYKYRIDGENIYIKVYRVTSSVFYKYGNIHIIIEGNFYNIKNIYIEDSHDNKLIWSNSD